MCSLAILGVDISSMRSRSSVRMPDATAQSVLGLSYKKVGPQCYEVYLDDPTKSVWECHIGRVVGHCSHQVWVYFPCGSDEVFLAPTRFEAINAFHQFLT